MVLLTVMSGYLIQFTGSMSLTKAALWTQILKEQSYYLALEEGLTQMLQKNAILPIDLKMSSIGDKSILKSTFSLCQLNRIERLGIESIFSTLTLAYDY